MNHPFWGTPILETPIFEALFDNVIRERFQKSGNHASCQCSPETLTWSTFQSHWVPRGQNICLQKPTKL